MYVRGGGGRGGRGLNINGSAPHYHNFEIDGWMTCHFMPFSTVFQSYQDRTVGGG